MANVIEQYWALGYRSDITAHDMFNMGKARMDADIAANLLNRGDAESQRLAEYFLDRIDFDSKTIRNLRTTAGDWNATLERGYSREIEHVHEACGKEIRSRWQPMMTDEEASDYLMRQLLESGAFKELGKDRAFDIKL